MFPRIRGNRGTHGGTVEPVRRFMPMHNYTAYMIGSDGNTRCEGRNRQNESLSRRPRFTLSYGSKAASVGGLSRFAIEPCHASVQTDNYRGIACPTKHYSAWGRCLCSRPASDPVA